MRGKVRLLGHTPLVLRASREAPVATLERVHLFVGFDFSVLSLHLGI